MEETNNTPATQTPEESIAALKAKIVELEAEVSSLQYRLKSAEDDSKRYRDYWLKSDKQAAALKKLVGSYHEFYNTL